MDEIQVIGSKIKTLPSRPPFMLDADLAMLYGTTTRVINQAVKRNPERFPEDFVFQLTQGEAESAGCEGGGRGQHRKYLPFGFTREGCNMLSAVLNSAIAVARSLQIMRAFSAMERGAGAAAAALQQLVETVASLKADLLELKGRPPVQISFPNDHALPVQVGRGTIRRKHHKILQFPEARDLALRMLREGFTYETVSAAISQAWPGVRISKSALARFWASARAGELKEFGIDVRI